MTIEKFIKENDVKYTTRLVGSDFILEAEKITGVSFGIQLREYIIKYGYLSYMFSELYGINSNQKQDSDLITQTVYLHKYYPMTENLIAIENQGEGDYYMVDKDDNVYEFDAELRQLNDKREKLFDYILERFEYIKNI